MSYSKLKSAVADAGGTINVHTTPAKTKHITVRLPDDPTTITSEAPTLDEAAEGALSTVHDLTK